MSACVALLCKLALGRGGDTGDLVERGQRTAFDLGDERRAILIGVPGIAACDRGVAGRCEAILHGCQALCGNPMRIEPALAVLCTSDEVVDGGLDPQR